MRLISTYRLQRCSFYLCRGILLAIIYKSIVYILKRVNEEEFVCSRNVSIPTTNNNATKLILLWTSTFFGSNWSLSELNYRYNQRICPYSQCEIIINRSQLCQSSALVFHLRDTFLNDLPSTRNRLKHQSYVLMTMEPPHQNPKFVAKMNSFFNWTMTYRHDSDILLKYVSHRNRSSPLSVAKINYLNGRSPRVLWISSNCATSSRREDYIRRLSKIIPTTILGKCRHSLSYLSTPSCTGLSLIDCLKVFSRNHTYYFAFENSFCLDYISEKYEIQVALHLMIPIVYDTKQNNNYKRLAIANSYIDASQFESPEALGEYLNNLILPALNARRPKYDHYFQWTNQYETGYDEKFHYTCELCRKLHVDSTIQTYSNMKKWFFEDANCYQWSNKYNRSIKIPLHEIISFTNRVMDETLTIASI